LGEGSAFSAGFFPALSFFKNFPYLNLANRRKTLNFHHKLKNPQKLKLTGQPNIFRSLLEQRPLAESSEIFSGNI